MQTDNATKLSKEFYITGINSQNAWRQNQLGKALIIQANETLLSMFNTEIAIVLSLGTQCQVKVERYIDPGMQALAEAIQSSTQGATMGMLGCSLVINWLLQEIFQSKGVQGWSDFDVMGVAQ
ncbi:hypothetical protein FGO68_gene5419 [Halteria grandinella]|uniref:Uncharacterized protein n=1 Tax=Halteria grandinella TaxID=5974 RepID=A0A8J8P662_HALGN|nr:hypothetical protein FGO68_gene5419 [Halteria grandinella]